MDRLGNNAKNDIKNISKIGDEFFIPFERPRNTRMRIGMDSAFTDSHDNKPTENRILVAFLLTGYAGLNKKKYMNRAMAGASNNIFFAIILSLTRFLHNM